VGIIVMRVRSSHSYSSFKQEFCFGVGNLAKLEQNQIPLCVKT